MIKLLYRAFYWTYDRGSWQWDVACLVFLAIIFTTPATFLEGYTGRPLEPQQIRLILLKILD